MGTGFSKRKKQAKMMQEQLSRMQEQVEKSEYDGEAGNGLVRVIVGGDHSIKSLKINPECVDPEDVEGLEDLIKAAFGNALAKMKDSANTQMATGAAMPNLADLAKGFGLG